MHTNNKEQCIATADAGTVVMEQRTRLMNEFNDWMNELMHWNAFADTTEPPHHRRTTPHRHKSNTRGR